MASTILARRKNYYELLEASNKQSEITNWLIWFAGVVIEAQRRTVATAEFLIHETKVLDRIKSDNCCRQQMKGFWAAYEAGQS